MSRAPQWVRASFVELSVRYRSLSVQARSAAMADRLGVLLRDRFVWLHEQPLLSRLHAELESRYSVELPSPPPGGTLDIGCVRQSRYFFQ